MSEANGDKNGGSITFPGWFLKTVGGVMLLFMGIFLPWATTMTVMTFNLSSKVERWNTLEQHLDEVRGISAANRLRIEEHDRRLNLLETKRSAGRDE